MHRRRMGSSEPATPTADLDGDFRDLNDQIYQLGVFMMTKLREGGVGGQRAHAVGRWRFAQERANPSRSLYQPVARALVRASGPARPSADRLWNHSACGVGSRRLTATKGVNIGATAKDFVRLWRAFSSSPSSLRSRRLVCSSRFSMIPRATSPAQVPTTASTSGPSWNCSSSSRTSPPRSSLFPLLKRQHEILSLGYVTARIMECVFILVGIIAVLAIVTLRHDAGADAAALGGLAESLAAIKDWTSCSDPASSSASGTG